MNRARFLPAMLLVVAVATTSQSAEFKLNQDDDGVTVKLDGKLLTRYLVKSGHKPVFWPVIGPNGKEITRAYPIVKEGHPSERKDHVHHRSFWFTHGNVNGVDFWSEGEKAGHIVHREFVKLEAGKSATIITRNDWMGPEGKVCEDERTFVFGADGKRWWVDCDLTVTASDGTVKFGDTKEGSFGVRLAGTMKVDAPGKGHIVNSNGQTDKAAWGKQAPWVDYYGPVDGEIVGVAILNHPSSFRYPSYWHVRTYGLFTANPFGLHHFKGRDFDGSHSMKKGDTFTLKYRVLFHGGDEKQGKVAEEFAKYSKSTK